MDTAMINTVATPPVAANGLAASQKQLDGNMDFAQLLMSLQNGEATEAGQNPLAGNTTMNWQDMLGLGQGISGLQNMAFPALGQTDPQTGLGGLAESIMQLLASMRTEGGEGQEELLALVEKLQKELQVSGGQMVAGQEMLVLLAQLSGQDLTPTLTEDGQMQLSLSGGQDRALQTLMTAPPEDIVKMLGGDKALFEKALQSLDTKSATAQTATAQAITGLQQAEVLTTKTQSTAAAETKAEPTMAQEATTPVKPQSTPAATTQPLQEKVAGVAKQSETTGKPQAADPVQQATQQSSGQFTLPPTVVTTGNVAPASAAAAAPMATQMQEGIQSGLQAGLEEFSIKLMPEGLGEVTVRLKQTDAGIKLTLVTKSAETQRLLVNEMDSLKDALRSMKVEVQEVLTSRQEQLLASQQGFQNQRQQQAWKEMHGAAYYRDEALGEAEEAELAEAPVLATALDALV